MEYYKKLDGSRAEIERGGFVEFSAKALKSFENMTADEMEMYITKNKNRAYRRIARPRFLLKLFHEFA